MGARLWACMPPRYVTKPTISTQPFILPTFQRLRWPRLERRSRHTLVRPSVYPAALGELASQLSMVIRYDLHVVGQNDALCELAKWEVGKFVISVLYLEANNRVSVTRRRDR